MSELDHRSAGEILYEFLQEMGMYENILQNEEDTKAKNIARFFEKIKGYENENPNAKFNEVIDYINLLNEVGESPTVNDEAWQENDAINILTVHSSKGLEFPVVFLVNLVNERFPSRNRSEDLPIPNELIKENLPSGDFHLQEERRLFYVGMTRAKERLFLTAGDYYGDGKRKKKISPFVMEALGDMINKHSLANEVGNQATIIKQYQKINYQNSKQKSPITNHQSLKVDYLSVSQIEAFKTCPMHYKLKYIYKLPTPPSASISFGISIHETLRNYFLSKRDILKIYKENFIEEGYLNKKHKQEFFEKGKIYLQGFVENAMPAGRQGYDAKIKTIALEQKFKIKFQNNLTVGGTIDRVDKLSKGRLEIIDYKTGASIPVQKEVDKDMQLSVYAMAVSEMYKVKPEDIKLSLYYLDTQEKITTSRTAKDLEKVKEEILKIRDEIENSDFKCSNSYFCQQGCEFKMFCKSE